MAREYCKSCHEFVGGCKCNQEIEIDVKDVSDAFIDFMSKAETAFSRADKEKNGSESYI